METFIKNLQSLKVNGKYQVIIDTDPGVDDSACLIYSFLDKNVDIKLLTTVCGNVSLEKATRNLLHLLDLFNLDIPVAMGAKRAMCRISEDATFIHQKEGLGGYVPPKTTKRQVVSDDAVETIYETIKAGDGKIIPLVLGPQTNFGRLLTEHPDISKKIPLIIFMGGSPFGHPDYPDHISFNISSDPESLKVVIESGIPLVMVPSDVGRRKAHLDEPFVLNLGKMNDAGKLLEKMYSMYWEPGYPDKRVATNDTLALFALVYPEIFTFKMADLSVDLEETPGKTFVDFNENGKVVFMADVDREKFLSLLITNLKLADDIKF